jgi:hypothetical protein
LKADGIRLGQTDTVAGLAFVVAGVLRVHTFDDQRLAIGRISRTAGGQSGAFLSPADLGERSATKDAPQLDTLAAMSHGIFTRDVLRDRFVTILSCSAASRDDIQVDFVAKFVFVSALPKNNNNNKQERKKKINFLWSVPVITLQSTGNFCPS